MPEREIPMNELKHNGPNHQFQCACGRKFFTNDQSSQNKVLYQGKTCPKCPDCGGVYNGSKLSDFQRAMAEENAAEKGQMFTACVSYGGNECRGQFIGRAGSMAEFT